MSTLWTQTKKILQENKGIWRENDRHLMNSLILQSYITLDIWRVLQATMPVSISELGQKTFQAYMPIWKYESWEEKWICKHIGCLHPPNKKNEELRDQN